MDVSEVDRPSDLGTCLRTLRDARGLSLAAMEAAARRLSPRDGYARTLPRSTVSDFCAGKTVPSDETLRTYLTVCGVRPPEVPSWLAAAARARTVDVRRPRGARKVRAVAPRGLGVHAAIEVPGASAGLPAYVPRDVDTRLRDELRTGACFVLLVGSSSVGKTRSAYEGLLAELPGHWLFHPRDTAELEAFAAAPTPRTVVWLDEIQRYLRAGLTAATVRALAGSVVVGTIWPDVYQAARTPPRPGALDDPYTTQREVLQLFSIVTVSARFSTAERDRAAEIAAADPRIAATWRAPHGMTQSLAAAPELVRRWEATPDRYAWALITAAVDAHRMGVQSPLSGDLLRTATPDYLTPAERAKAPGDWFETALDYAVTELHGAASVLEPVAAEMGHPTGYAVADFVHQHGGRTRRMLVPPEGAWYAYHDHLTSAADRLSAGQAAEDRKLYRHAERLYRSAASQDPVRLALLLHKTGRTADNEAADARIEASRLESDKRYADAIRAYERAIDAGAEDAYHRLGSLLVDLGRLTDPDPPLYGLFASDSPRGYFLLAEGFQRLGRKLERLGAAGISSGGVVETDDSAGRNRRSWFLLDQGRHDEIEEIWRKALDAGRPDARTGWATFLSQMGRSADARRTYQEAVRAGEPGACGEFARFLERQGDLGEAERYRRLALAAGERESPGGLAEVLTMQGRDEEARHLERYGLHPDGSIAGPDTATPVSGPSAREPTGRPRGRRPRGRP